MGTMIRKFEVIQAVHRADATEIERKAVRRAAIISPRERSNAIRQFLYFGRSITKLANFFGADEKAIENVIRQDMYHLYPPVTRRAE